MRREPFEAEDLWAELDDWLAFQSPNVAVPSETLAKRTAEDARALARKLVSGQ